MALETDRRFIALDTSTSQDLDDIGTGTFEVKLIADVSTGGKVASNCMKYVCFP